jgi:CBS domain-containing protein
MTPYVESVTELDTVAKACAVMKEAMIRRVFVVDHRTGVRISSLSFSLRTFIVSGLM